MSTKTVLALLSAIPLLSIASEQRIKLFILAGDELMLEQGLIDGRSETPFDAIYPNAEKTSGEAPKHAVAAVYPGAYSATTDYDALTPTATGLIEFGEQRTRQIRQGFRGREPVPYTPFPDVAMQDGHTTVVRGWVEVPHDGHYEFLPGDGESAFNLTEVNGLEAYRRETDQAVASITPIRLTPGQRHAFRTVFFGKPGHAFRVVLLDKPGALTTVVANQPEFGFLKNPEGSWATRDDVVLFDAHPIHNNTETAGHFLAVGDVAYGGRPARGMIGVEQTLGHTLGNHFDEPVMLVRFATHHPATSRRGSRALASDYLPPSSGGTAAADAGWDVIHFNWGIWDIAYRDPKPGDRWHSCKINGKLTTPIDVFEDNLRKLVLRMKETGATLVWGSITPIHPDQHCRFEADPGRYNAVAAKIMQEHGVIINDLHAESIRMGFPKAPDVHSTGNLGPKAIAAIEAALATRENPGQPRPRVLLIGDSITGSYQNAVSSHFDGRADVYKNPGNAEHTGTGLKHIEEWLNLDTYLISGQEYIELLNGVKKTLSDMERYFPGYAGQPVELAGLFWFQGIADASSAQMAAEYQKHLPNLIADLRRDLDTPGLPVVVTAIGWDGTHAGPVRTAQLASHHPANHVAALDTRNFLHPREISPSSRSETYHNHAKSFLEIGNAMGEKMLDLLKSP